MIAVVCVEKIGRDVDNVIGLPKRYGCWIVSDKMVEQAGKWDYTDSNSKGSRGIKIWYFLKPGCLYFIKSPISWKRIDEYYCVAAKDGNVLRLTKEEAISWLKDN